MRLVVSVCAIAAVAAVSRAEADPPTKLQQERTKIVRIERPRGGSHEFMFCDIRGTEATCIGPHPPKLGEHIEVVDEVARVAELRVTGTTQRDTRDAACQIMWSVQYEIERGTVENGHGQLAGLIGVEVTPQGHKLSDHSSRTLTIPASAGSGNEESVLIGVDRNGDNELDYALTLYSCSGSGTGRSYGGDYCVNVWSIDHDKYTRLQQITNEQLQPCLR